MPGLLIERDLENIGGILHELAKSQTLTEGEQAALRAYARGLCQIKDHVGRRLDVKNGSEDWKRMAAGDC